MINISRYNGTDWYFWFRTDWQGYITLVKSIGTTEGTNWKAEIC